MPCRIYSFRTKAVETGKVNDKQNVLESSLFSYCFSAKDKLVSPPGLGRPCGAMVSLCVGNSLFDVNVDTLSQ